MSTTENVDPAESPDLIHRIASLTRMLRDSMRELGLDQAIKDGFDARMASHTDQQAMNQTFYDTATQRAQKMEQLANQVDSASDLKAISDLQARIAIESAQLNNELIKLQSLNQVAQQQRETRQQQMHQRAFQTSFKYKSAN